MKFKMMQLSLVASTTLLLLLVLTPGYTTQGYAAVLANITSTPTEPPPPPTETPAPPTATPTRPTEVPPTFTPAPGTPTVVPPDATPTPDLPIAPATATPRPNDDDDDDGGSSSTPELPTATPTDTPLPSATPPITLTDDVVADPSVSKRISQGEANPGDEVTYTIDVVNRGNIAAENVVVTDSLPDELTIVDVSASRGDISMRGQSVSVNIGLMEPGEQVTIRINARVKTDTEASTISNGVVVTTTSPGDDPSNNTASVPLTIIQTAVLPAALPQTGAANEVLWVLLAALGVLLLVGSIALRRQTFR
ncbi:MAG: hypothetical protein GFH27_549327n25 [Chloroflexi bacterium AL-W]|nr:hypothetical protein [Chloroflexi bacterium AL-N1]NOK69637.1 hypothetical protein [Chloroflexi bacterium AL-N10]NOK72184.1 hypothetical protein [Chloroflexi bacterium AL-N5]NOK85013.1 hypothetical protein [Chloroflexi bacterium AL-W]NOK91766.1 hypothetical protein [Chloroflexi bacterium AL-N15]